MSLSNRVERIERQVGGPAGDWVEIPYAEFSARQGIRVTQFLESVGIRARKCADPTDQRRGARGFEDCPAKRVLLEYVKQQEQRGAQQEEREPWWRWRNPYTSQARFFVRRDVYEGLPSLEAAEPERNTP